MLDAAKALKLDQRRGARAGRARENAIEATLLPIASTVIMVLCGVPVPFVLLLVPLGMFVGFAVCILPGWTVIVLLGVALVGSGALWGHTLPWMIPAVIFALGGGICLWNYFAASHALKSKRTQASVRLAWDEGKQRPELDAPSWGVVKARIEGLRGGDRSMLTVFNGQKRLDICCTAPDKFLVIFTAALGHDREDVYQAVPISPAAVDPRDLIDVEFGGLAGRYPAGRFVPRATAITAARAFLTSGERDTSVIWDQETRHHEIVKPPTLPQS